MSIKLSSLCCMSHSMSILVISVSHLNHTSCQDPVPRTSNCQVPPTEHSNCLNCLTLSPSYRIKIKSVNVKSHQSTLESSTLKSFNPTPQETLYKSYILFTLLLFLAWAEAATFLVFVSSPNKSLVWSLLCAATLVFLGSWLPGYLPYLSCAAYNQSSS